MERIFTYIAAILSRILFSFHVGLTIWWVTLVTDDNNLWYIMAIYLSCLLLETSVTVFYRKGHEYYWFCPSIFIFTIVEILCFSILRMKLGECWRMTPGLTDGIIRCSTNISRTGIESQIDTLGLATLVTDDEKIISNLDQTFLLLLVIGRWLLPKGQMSRDQLSQLLFIYIAAAADIVELTEIYEVRAVLNNESITNLVISLWSISLLQFSVTIQNAETIAQEKGIAEVKLEKQKEKNGDTIEIMTGKRSNRIAPALYTYKLAQRKAMERQRERRSTMNLDALQPTSKIEPSPPTVLSTSRTGLSRVIQTLRRFESSVQLFIHTYIDLIQLLTPMLLQDGPFLILRIYIASKYDISDSNMFLFLIAKNALVVLLQLYRICVLYCKPREEPEEEDIFNEQEAVRLRNVQTALASVGTATLTIHAAVPPTKRKRSRAFSLSFVNKITSLKRKRQSESSKRQSSKTSEDEEAAIQPTENEVS